MKSPAPSCPDSASPIGCPGQVSWQVDEPGTALPNTPELTLQQELADFESIIEKSKADSDAMCRALMVIFEERLYLAVQSSWAKYLRDRWGMSRSRGYQWIHYARLHLAAELKSELGPLNERQARQWANTGLFASKPPTDASSRLRRTGVYVRRSVAALAQAERRQFISELRAILDEVEQGLEVTVAPENSIAQG